MAPAERPQRAAKGRAARPWLDRSKGELRTSSLTVTQVRRMAVRAAVHVAEPRALDHVADRRIEFKRLEISDGYDEEWYWTVNSSRSSRRRVVMPHVNAVGRVAPPHTVYLRRQLTMSSSIPRSPTCRSGSEAAIAFLSEGAKTLVALIVGHVGILLPRFRPAF